MKVTVQLIVAGLVSLMATASMADTNTDYYQIANIKTELVQDAPSTSQKLMDLAVGTNCSAQTTQSDLKIQDIGLGEVGVVVDQVINLGKKIWDIVEAGKPVMNIQFDVATALPQGTQCWVQLENWKQPVSQTYRVSATNGFGANVVTFDYRVLYIYGGSYNGQGNYIGYATTQPANVSVAWGFTLNAKSSVPMVMNTGTKAAPVGAMQMNMDYTISTAIGTTEQSQAYFITGLGDIKLLNN